MTAKELRKKIKDDLAAIKGLLVVKDAEGKPRHHTDAEKDDLKRRQDAYEADKAALEQLERYEVDEARFAAADAEPQPAAAEPVGAFAETRGLRIGARPTIQPREAAAPAVHTEVRNYSIARAMRRFFVETRGRLDGVEGEISRDIELRSRAQPQGFFMPLGTEPEYREMFPETRDLTTSTGTGGVFVTRHEPFIEFLRNQLVVKRAGATVLTDLQGNIAFPRQSGTATAYWVAEGVSASASNQTLDQVTMTGKQVIGLTNITRLFLAQSSVDAEAFVKNDLAQVLAQAIDLAAINGSGGSGAPLGILQDTAVQSVSSGLSNGTNGGALTWANIVAVESALNAANANRGRVAWLSTNQIRGALKVTPKIGTTFPVFMWDDAMGVDADGVINGYPAYATGNVPSNLTKGTGTGLSALVFGNFQDLVVGQWGGIDILENPYTLQASGGRTISAAMLVDTRVIRPASFRIMTDIVA